MARYTFDTTKEQDYAIALNHALRAPEKTVDEFVAGSIGTELATITSAFIELRIQRLVDLYRVATPEQREQVDTILGVIPELAKAVEVLP